MQTLTKLAPALFLLATACGMSAGEEKDPPVLKVTSPERSLVTDNGDITVTGTVAPNAEGIPVHQVSVNGVAATVEADGSFHAAIHVEDGASFIETVALDDDGGKATDTRAVQAGDLRAAGGTVDSALTVAMSTQAFAKISAAAGPMIKSMDLGAMLAPMQPMQHAGDENGEDCLFDRVFVDDLKLSDISLSLTPQQGGLAFSATIDGLDVPAHARYAVACVSNQTDLRVTADRVVISGTLLVSPDGMQGFSTDLVNQSVQLTNFKIDASGIPGTIIDLIDFNGLVQTVVAKGAELAMKPMMNAALGGLAGPKQVDVLGRTLTVEVTPSNISFDPQGALVTMNMAMLIGGAENAKYVYTPNGQPAMDPGNGFHLGLADDLANEMMSEANAIGLLNLEMPAAAGTFDSTAIEMTLPPMISADPVDGKMRVFLGDMMATYKSHGVAVAKAAVNAKLDVKINTAGNGYAVALELGKPDIKFDVLDDIANETRLTDEDLASASAACLDAQIAHISALLVNIPLPSIAGLQMRNLEVGSNNGYVMVKGQFE